MISVSISVIPVLAAGMLLTGQEPAQKSPYPVKPSVTEAAITAFNDPHLVYFNRSVKPRSELLFFLPGTNGKPGGTNLFCQTAADLGYHTLALSYPTDTPATAVRNSSDPQAFEKFRLEIIEGKDLSPQVSVSRANSIENRLIKLLQYLDKSDPKGGWGQYLTASGALNWPRIAVSGHSQGGGHAAVIATKHRVARAIMTGAPKDFDRVRNKPAAWYGHPATPVSGLFTFNHELDRQGCDFAQQLLICKAMGLDKFGSSVRVDEVPSPFRGSRILTTNFKGSPTDSVRAHSSVISDRGCPKGQDGKPIFRPVWEWMMTAPVSPL
ncbi:MAG: hypothetical protein V4671_07310 [Armatimonadota bacterium]